MKTFYVYLIIIGENSLFRGAGSWGKGATVEAARKIARAELRNSFGSEKVKERIEEVEEDDIT
jgi:hypothetical protein